MYEEPSTRKTWSPFFSGRASPAVAPDGETFEISPFSGLSFSGFAAGMGGMWAVRAPLATPDATGSREKPHPPGGSPSRFFGAIQNRSGPSNRKRRKVSGGLGR